MKTSFLKLRTPLTTGAGIHPAPMWSPDLVLPFLHLESSEHCHSASVALFLVLPSPAIQTVSTASERLQSATHSDRTPLVDCPSDISAQTFQSLPVTRKVRLSPSWVFRPSPRWFQSTLATSPSMTAVTSHLLQSC